MNTLRSAMETLGSAYINKKRALLFLFCLITLFTLCIAIWHGVYTLYPAPWQAMLHTYQHFPFIGGASSWGGGGALSHLADAGPWGGGDGMHQLPPFS